MTDYADLVAYIVKSIVDNPDDVDVDVVSNRNRAETVEVRLHQDDVGRVIGKGGRNIEAIRAVVKAAAIKDHHRVNVEVVAEDEDRDEDDDDREDDDDDREDEDADTDEMDGDDESPSQPPPTNGGGDSSNEE